MAVIKTLSKLEKEALAIEARAARKVAGRTAVKGGVTSAEHAAMNAEAIAMKKMADAGGHIGPRRAAMTAARRVPMPPPPPRPRTGFNKYAHNASQWAKGHKKIVAGAGAVALAGTAFSNNTGPGSPKGNQNQARGMYGF